MQTWDKESLAASAVAHGLWYDRNGARLRKYCSEKKQTGLYGRGGEGVRNQMLPLREPGAGRIIRYYVNQSRERIWWCYRRTCAYSFWWG